MSEAVDIQCFARDGTWVKPAGAIRVECYLRGGDGSHDDGEMTAAWFDADRLPAKVHVTVGRSCSGAAIEAAGKRQYPRPRGVLSGADGYALILTHLAVADG